MLRMVLVTYFCVITYLKITIFYLIVSVGLEYRSRLARWFWLKIASSWFNIAHAIHIHLR